MALGKFQKAEARVLRKALGLCRVYSSEEVQEGLDAIQSVSENVSDEHRPIADNAKTAIQSMSQRLGIDSSKLISSMEMEDKVLDQLSYKESHQVIARLNEYLRGEENKGMAIPEEIKLEMIF
jgi:DNA relaxase NicK